MDDKIVEKWLIQKRRIGKNTSGKEASLIGNLGANIVDIRGYLQTSLIEWPGKISAVVWVSGCNFRCPFCDNRDLVLHPEKLPKIAEKEIFKDLKERKGFIDSLVVTGGEPTLQPDLPNFLRKVKKIGLLMMIETNGAKPEVIAQLLNCSIVERISLDVKGLLEHYARITKVQTPISKIKESMRLIIRSGIDFEFRTTVVPTFHPKKNLIKLAKQLKGLTEELKNRRTKELFWFLQQFQPENCLDPRFEKIKPYSQKELEEILKAVQRYIPGAKLRGV